jgi:micrococcal nuclease
VDHYGRVLAHVYDIHDQSLAAHILRKGMAMQIVVPPNIAQTDCLKEFERSARLAGLGVWGNDYWRVIPIAALANDRGGFRRVSGRVVKVDVVKAIRLVIDGGLVVRISAADRGYFTAMNLQDWRDLKGKKVELRGWLVVNKNAKTRQSRLIKYYLRLRSPAALAVIAG